MRSIWKFKLDGRAATEMPAGAVALSAHAQNEEICVWALVDPEAPRELRAFSVIGTGWAMAAEPQGKFLGTVLLAAGAPVFHVFDDGPAPTL